MLVISRFRAPEVGHDELRSGLEEALHVLATQRGFVDGAIGRNVDDPELWVLQTRWEGPGPYRRALSAYEVKVQAGPTLGRALEEPTAYELLAPGEPPNEARPRAT